MIEEATTDEKILGTFSVMRELRPHLEEDEYLELVRRLQTAGYRLVFAAEGRNVRCVAGFRVVEFLAWDKVLYVDDIITGENARSEGRGKRMLDWLAGVVRKEGCSSLQLASGVQRHGAHRFYMREGMNIFSYYFSKAL